MPKGGTTSSHWRPVGGSLAINGEACRTIMSQLAREGRQINNIEFIDRKMDRIPDPISNVPALTTGVRSWEEESESDKAQQN